MKRRTHLTWSVEKDGKCPKCRSLTVLITAQGHRTIHEDGYREQGGKRELPDYASVDEEVSGHWCPKCQRITSLSLNT
jgi:hypothetical protein